MQYSTQSHLTETPDFHKEPDKIKITYIIQTKISFSPESNYGPEHIAQTMLTAMRYAVNAHALTGRPVRVLERKQMRDSNSAPADRVIARIKAEEGTGRNVMNITCDCEDCQEARALWKIPLHSALGTMWGDHYAGFAQGRRTVMQQTPDITSLQIKGKGNLEDA